MLDQLFGVRMTLLIGKGVPRPAPLPVMEQFVSAEIAISDRERSGFELVFDENHKLRTVFLYAQPRDGFAPPLLDDMVSALHPQFSSPACAMASSTSFLVASLIGTIGKRAKPSPKPPMRIWCTGPVAFPFRVSTTVFCVIGNSSWTPLS